MRRREFIKLFLLGTIGWPRATMAQQTGPGSVGDHADAVLTIPSRINTSSPITIQPCNASRRGPVTFSSLELMALARG